MSKSSRTVCRAKDVGNEYVFATLTQARRDFVIGNAHGGARERVVSRPASGTCTPGSRSTPAAALHLTATPHSSIDNAIAPHGSALNLGRVCRRRCRADKTR